MIQKKCSKFVSKLYDILEEQNCTAIRWNEDGDAVEINNIDQLVEQILSVHYKQTSFLSFSRQLNQYGFQKHRMGKKTYIFKHPFFQKHKKEDLINVVSSHKIKTLKTQALEQNDENLVNLNEQNLLACTIKKLQNQQHQICQQFREQVELQSQIKQIIIFIKKRIYECDQTIDNSCFIAQLHLVKAMNLIPNDEAHQQEMTFIRQILEEFSNIYMEYNEAPMSSQRDPNFSARSYTPIPFNQFQQNYKCSFGTSNNAQLKQNIANYLIWLEQWYKEALQLYGNLK